VTRPTEAVSHPVPARTDGANDIGNAPFHRSGRGFR